MSDPTPAEYERVTNYLKAKHRTEGGLNEFELSIATQFVTNKRLSRKQVDAILAKADAPHLPGPEFVPAGNYALGSGESWTFYRVWRPKDNPKVVRCYLLESDEDEDGAQVNTLQTLNAIIAAGPAVAARSYGARTGKCSICSRRLSNALSRKLRIGPVCLGRFYEEDDAALQRLEASMWRRDQGIDPKADLPRSIDLEALEAVAPILHRGPKAVSL
jgi:hypothetical protein